ncbi:MAG: hypothetical protein IJ229_06085 [Clostridia bacterium]|nr:hypothetical protein [Clostridia bacterium]MBR1685656.1 hypothetical protein [Clostridia bacterium]
MRCSCKECGTYMVQADSSVLGCVCPDCGYRCQDCLGTNTVVSRERLRDLAFDPRFSPENILKNFVREQEEEAEAEADRLIDMRGDEIYGY